MEAKRYLVKNGNEPTSGKFTEEKESKLEGFIDYAKIVVGTLGHKVFEKLTEIKTPSENTIALDGGRLLLHLKRKSRKSGLVIEANCKQTNEGVVVLKGSQIETIDSDSMPPGIKESHQRP